MSQKAYLIKRIEELEAKKKVLGDAETPIEKTSDPKPADTLEPEKSSQDPGERPECLRGCSSLEMACMYADGTMPTEAMPWYQKKAMKRTGVLTPLSWMGI